MRRAIVISLAVALDLALGDPPNRFHPVVVMGNWLSSGRRLAPQSHRFWFGAGWIVLGITVFALPFWRVENTSRKQPRGVSKARTKFYRSARQLVLHAVLLKPMFAYRNLRRSVASVATALAAEDLNEARRLANWHLVSRDTSQLTSQEVAGAAIESLAENITDSLSAPLLAYAIGGLPAAWAYRFVNTADSMWGYQSTEFAQLGKFPARLDDMLNWLPARLTAWLLVVAAVLAGEDGRRAARVMVAQHGRTRSPNAGWTMSAMAGALGVTLTKRGAYRLTGGVSKPEATTVKRALRVADICAASSIVVLVLSRVIYDVSRP
jgi:adenosylcobinamide-phosphate synthase